MRMFKLLESMPERIIYNLENKEVPFTYYLLTFFFILIIRSFFESFSQSEINYLDLQPNILGLDLLHYSLSYVTVALILMLLIHIATREKFKNIIKILFPAFILLLLTPFIDLIITGGKGHDIRYLPPNSNIDLIKLFFTYIGEYQGVSLGIRIETMIAFICCYFYLRVKGQSIFKSFFYTFLCYFFIFLWGASPIIINEFLNLFGLRYQHSSSLMITYYSLLILVLGLWAVIGENKSLVLTLLKDIRATRIIYYQLMIIFGISLALSSNSLIHVMDDRPEIIIDTLFLMISIFFSAVFAIICNNIADVEIDRVSNMSRPLVKNIIDIKTYEIIGYISFAVSLYYSCIVGIKALFIILFINGVYYIYSMPPLRLKRLFLISKLAISCSSLALIFLGYILVQGNLLFFPKNLIIIFLVGYTLAANFIDIKDVEGDAATGIKTLPVILGLRASKIIIGIGFFVTYLALGLLSDDKFIIAIFTCVGVFQFYLINKKQYKEWQICVLYIFSFIFLINDLLFLNGQL